MGRVRVCFLEAAGRKEGGLTSRLVVVDKAGPDP